MAAPKIVEVRAVTTPGKERFDPAQDDYEVKTEAGEVYRRFRGVWFHVESGLAVADDRKKQEFSAAVQRYLFACEEPEGDWYSVKRKAD